MSVFSVCRLCLDVCVLVYVLCEHMVYVCVCGVGVYVMWVYTLGMTVCDLCLFMLCVWYVST